MPFVQGGKDFRPVGLAVAPDGSLYVTDWVLKDYTLHGKGAVWHIRWKEDSHPERPKDPKLALASHHRPLREAAVAKMAIDQAGGEFLRKQLSNPDVRIRTASLTALINSLPGLFIDADDEAGMDLRKIVASDTSTGFRAMALRYLAKQDFNMRPILEKRYPDEMRREAVAGLEWRQEDVPRLL